MGEREKYWSIAYLDELAKLAERMKPNAIHDCMKYLEAAYKHAEELESSWSQVSKALCGMENGTVEDVLRALDQLKAESEKLKKEKQMIEKIVVGSAGSIPMTQAACLLCNSKNKFTGEQCRWCDSGSNFALKDLEDTDQ